MNRKKGETVLALETGIDGGSLSIFKTEKLIASAGGAENLSKSEEILTLIEKTLAEHSIEKTDLKLIVAADGPGSVTGIRIGLATAKGLAQALGLDFCEVSTLRALAFSNGSKAEQIAAYYQRKQGTVYFAEFNENKTVPDAVLGADAVQVHQLKLPEFLRYFEEKESESASFNFTQGLYEALKANGSCAETGSVGNIHVLEEPLSNYIGRWGIEKWRLITTKQASS